MTEVDRRIHEKGGEEMECGPEDDGRGWRVCKQGGSRLRGIM